ncbi:homoserine kinase [Mesobacillus foraminis]|uniref:homoserine kinase n=1 Tax=Mesobacillus foraminis TaxID=279826 RepID=UPI000EF45AD2|nr:homoserine kinase [Mesobacillus foraminis]
MSRGGVFTASVPASSANLGPGFDSIGLAVNLYLTVEAISSAQWEIIALTPELEKFPVNEQNYIAQIAIKTARLYGKEMPPLKMAVSSEIPLARGLGSSASAIIAGIELASHFCGLSLTKQEKLEISAEIEGHPDNVGASIYGGLVVGSQLETGVDVTVFSEMDMDVVAVIPEDELLTESSREVLPSTLDYSKAVEASAVSNQLLASLLTGQWKLAGKMMDSDVFHQPYRRSLVPWWGEIEQLAREAGAFGTALSGAGPSILCLAEPGKGQALAASLEQSLDAMQVIQLKIDRSGSKVNITEEASKDCLA